MFEPFKAPLQCAAREVAGHADPFRIVDLSSEGALAILEERILSGGTILLRGDGDVLHPTEFGLDSTAANANSTTNWSDSKEFFCEDSRNCEEESRAQRVLVTLTVARAIYEVLMLAKGTPLQEESVVSWYKWLPMHKAPNSRAVMLAGAEIPIGRYSPIGPTRLRYGFMGLVDVGTTTLFEGKSEGARGTLGVEWFPGLVPPGKVVKGRYVPKFYDLAVAVGGAYRFDETSPGTDATARLYLLWPRLDMHVSGGLRFSRFSLSSGSSIRLVPELRYGKTFGFLGIYLGGSYDFREEVGGGLDRTLGIQAGFQFVPPAWRVARYLDKILN